MTGVIDVQKDGFGFLRFYENDMLPSDGDVFVSNRMVEDFALRNGSELVGIVGEPARSGHKANLDELKSVDGMDPKKAQDLPKFEDLTVVDPDFQYELGQPYEEDGEEVPGDISMRILDMLVPIGRGQRALLVSPPRAGKTILLQKIAQSMQRLYPDVEVMVLLVDERPEEGTEWKRTIDPPRNVFLSTLDQGSRNHVELAEAVWRRAVRMVECGREVILLLDSITRLGRAANAERGGGGRTMSGGIDSRAMERPKKFFGSARNTEEAGSLAIVGTALVDTGSRMDQVIFEEFKGTGNAELVLNRALADRRIYPAIDLELSGTRKEEKLISKEKLPRVNLLRRVLGRMRGLEAMELLLPKIEAAETNEEFLNTLNLDNY